MRFVLNIFLFCLPFFVLVLAGFVATQRGWLEEVAIGGLNSFVLYFALPCMLFRFGAGLPVAQLFNAPLFALYLGVQLIMLFGLFALTRRGGVDANNAAFGSLVTSFPNTGYMGVPLLVGLFGDRAAAPAILTILVDLCITSSLAIALSRMQTGQAGSPRQALGNALKGVLKNPMPWAILSGAACSVLAIQLPAPAAKTIGLLADAASPVALFTIGAVLARSRKWALLHPSTNALMQDVWPLALVKLFVHPLLVLGAGVVVQAAGLRIDAFSLAIVALVAALPSASNVTLLAERMQADVGRLAQIILVSTALAIFSFSGFVAWLGPQ